MALLRNERSFIAPRHARQLNFTADDCMNFRDLERLGIFLGQDQSRINSFLSAMDAALNPLQPTVTTGTITTPIQFLQNWLPGFVHIITQARKIDELVGKSTMGAWEDEEVVQGVLELTATALPYGDYTNIPFASWNNNFNRFTVVRYEQGIMVSTLDQARAARINIDDGASKRESAALALEIQRNYIGFYGYNNGLNRTYGFLNDPGLPAYVTAATGAGGGTEWAGKTFLEITADIRSMIVGVRTSSGDQIDPLTQNMTLALPTNVVDYMSTESDFGITVMNWMNQTYPKIRVVSAPELTAANGGDNVGYLYAEKLNDMSTDDGRVFMPVVPAVFMVLGVQQTAKGYVEDYTNATAGVFCKRPYAVYRITGI